MKLGAKHNSNSRGVGIKFLCKVATIFVALFLGVSLTYAYFTARAEEKQEIYFANISVDFVNSNDVYTTTLFDGQTLGGVQPGQKINLNSVYVKNIGEYDVYAIYKLTMNITKVGATEAETFVYWYNLDGTVLSGDETSTTDKATLLATAAKKQTNLVLSISGELDNSYKKATANIDLQVLAIQGLIKEETNLDKAIQACQLLIKNQDQADIEHTLYIRPNGGTYNNSNTTQTISQNRDTTLSIGTPTREGYTFKGWAFSGDGKFASSTYTFGKSVGTLTAQWQANNYTMSFDYGNNANPNILKFNDYILESRSGKYIVKFPVDNLVIGKTYTLSSAKPIYWVKISNAPDGHNSTQHDPSKAVTSYTFTMARNSNIPSSETQYLYIGLKKGATSLPADISAYDGYNLKLEEGSTATAYIAPNKTVAYGSTYGTLPTPTRDGYTFNGWKRQLYYSTAELKATGTFMACVDLAPYIDKYGLVEYTVEFDLKSADTTNGNIILGYMQNGAGTKYSGFYQNCNVTTEYKHFSYDFTATKGDKYGIQSQAMLAFYGFGKQGNLAIVKNIKVMLKKPYTTASSVYQDATNVVLVASWTAKTASTSVQAQNQTYAQTTNDFVLPSKQNFAN